MKSMGELVLPAIKTGIIKAPAVKASLASVQLYLSTKRRIRYYSENVSFWLRSAKWIYVAYVISVNFTLR